MLGVLLEVLVFKDHRIHEDIRHGKAIIIDAVVKLGDSFNGLNQQTRSQQQVVASLINEDNVSQLLAHAEREIGEQDQVLADLRGRLQSFLGAVRGGLDGRAALCNLSDGL